MNITLIAAIGKNNELGAYNKLLWYIPDDLKFFKKMTMNKIMVMGRNTFESLPGVLPGRKHLVLTSKDISGNDQVMVFDNINNLFEYLDMIDYNSEVMIIGGASVYRQFIDLADKMLITEIDCSSEEADSFFPDFDKLEWECEELKSSSYKGINYRHVKYLRKR